MQLTEHEDLRVKLLSFNQSITASTCDSAEKHRDTGPGIWLGRWATSSSAGFTTVLTGSRSKCSTVESLSLSTRKLGVQFISGSDKYWETCRVVFQTKIVWIKRRFPIKKIIPQDIISFLGTTNLSSDSLTRQMLPNLFSIGTEITCLLKRDLNSWSRNTKVESLNTCTREL